MLKKLIAVACMVFMVGCTTGNDQIKNLTTQTVNELARDGMTKTELVQGLGEPTSETKDTDGNSILEFIWMRSRPSATNFIPLKPSKNFMVTKKVLRTWLGASDGRLFKKEFSGVYYIKHVPLLGADTIEDMRPLTEEELNSYTDPEE